MHTSLNILVSEVAKLPEEQQFKILPSLSAVVVEDKKHSNILKDIKENIGTLRLNIKYLLFDLEATRRERDEARSTNGYS